MGFGDVVGFFDVPFGSPTGMTKNDNFLWIIDTSTSLLYKFTKIGTILSIVTLPYPKANGLAHDGVNMWNSTKLVIYQITETGTILSSFPVIHDNITNLTEDGTNLWYTRNAVQFLYEITKTGTILQTVFLNANGLRGLSHTGTNIWHTEIIAGLVENIINKITETGVLLSTFDVTGFSSHAIVHDDFFIWSVFNQSRIVQIFSINPFYTKTITASSCITDNIKTNQCINEQLKTTQCITTKIKSELCV